MRLASHAQGATSILVDQTDDFTWQRRACKRAFAHVKTEDDTARSAGVGAFIRRHNQNRRYSYYTE